MAIYHVELTGDAREVYEVEAGSPEGVRARQVAGPALESVPCPSCARVGSLGLADRLVARPLGTWSLAGRQMKASAVWEVHIVCGADGCEFEKEPS